MDDLENFGCMHDSIDQEWDIDNMGATDKDLKSQLADLEMKFNGKSAAASSCKEEKKV